jgi:signal transduction histidine kinase
VEYSNLAPGNYVFRVTAANNSGVWNEAGATLEFSIAPAWFQTDWFYASCVLASLLITWTTYRFRMRQVARGLHARFDERLSERTRIARDLHDTLLQSFQASLIQMQRARNHFSRSTEEAIRTLDNAIGSAEHAIVEGRDAIQDLRLTVVPQSNLEHLLTVAGQELAKAHDANGIPPMFRVTVEGPHRSLSPILQDEVYRIGREVLRNAFRHSQASRIEAEIRYDKRKLRLRIRDDGKGIDQKIMAEGAKAGHWGLPGARERATRIGARLDFWSEAGAGTEVELTVPASMAYAKPQALRRFGLFRRKKVL